LINELARGRGYKPETLWMLLKHDLIGQYDGHFAFPVDNDGITVGCHYVVQARKKFWYYTQGCTASPLLLGIGPQYHATESTWDGIALVDRFGFEEITAVVTRGASNGKSIATCVPAGELVHLWPQNDKYSKQWLEDAIASLPETLICETPEDFKDPNEWFACL
jgi:hypothetical protein